MATMESILDTRSESAPRTSEIVFLASRSRAATIVWAILTACCVLIGALPYFTYIQLLPVIDQQALHTLLLTFTTFAIFLGVSSLFIKFYLLVPQRLMRLAGRNCKDSEDSQCTLKQFVQMWMTFSVIIWGINESIASLGLAVALASSEPSRALPFAFVAVILNLASRPDLRENCIEAGLYTPAKATHYDVVLPTSASLDDTPVETATI